MDGSRKYVDMVREKILQLSQGMDGEIFLFGSRARGDFGRDSDMDIGCDGMSLKNFRRLERDFRLYWEESDVPYDVDLVDFSHGDERFRTIAEKDKIVWKNA